jgi:membrane-associated phospholipid phosphatase
MDKQYLFDKNERGDSMQQKHKDEDQKKQIIDEQTPNRVSLGEQVEEGVGDVVKEAQQEVASARRPWYQSIRWGRILLVVYAMLIVLFALLSWWVFYHPVLAIDVTITREFQENQAPWLRFIMLAVSFTGNVTALSLGLIVLATALFWIVDLRLEAVMVVALSATSDLLNGLIKIIVARPRPTSSLVEIIQNASGNSFPSGHVMAYIAFWGLLFTFAIILFKDNRWWRTALLVISGLFVVLVGPSRIYLGDHWASDVLGAYLIGGVLLGIALWIYLALKSKGVLAPRKNRARLFHEKYLR